MRILHMRLGYEGDVGCVWFYCGVCVVRGGEVVVVCFTMRCWSLL